MPTNPIADKLHSFHVYYAPTRTDSIEIDPPSTVDRKRNALTLLPPGRHEQ